MKTTSKTAALLACALAAHTASAADFTFNPTDAGGVGFEQRWNQAGNWTLNSGVDDGTAGIPDGLDTFTIDRNSVGRIDFNNTDLSNEGLPDHTIAKITGTGAPGRDIILKFTGVLTLNDLEVLPSVDAFEIQLERDTDFFINGVISGSGDLLLSRAASFSDVEPGEETVIGGTAGPNTNTGNVRLFNANLDNPAEPAFFVADKVGAFGQASTLTLEGRAGGNTTSLILTANTIGGEGAIDDDATSVVLGENGIFDVAAGVDEVIGSGLLDVLGIGVIADGTYDNAESWITGDGTITVGGGPSGPAADLSGDGDVDDEDLGLFFSAFTGPDNGPSLDPRADLSGDGDVDDEDLGLAFSEFTGPLGPASVPEPTSLALLGLGGLLAARRRRA